MTRKPFETVTARQPYGTVNFYKLAPKGQICVVCGKPAVMVLENGDPYCNVHGGGDVNAGTISDQQVEEGSGSGTGSSGEGSEQEDDRSGEVQQIAEGLAKAEPCVKCGVLFGHTISCRLGGTDAAD